MSWSVLENALTQTATDVPVRELALSDAKLSDAWGLRLTRCSELRNDSRVRPSRDSRAGRLRRARRAPGPAALPAAEVTSRRVKNLRIMGAISVSSWRPARGAIDRASSKPGCTPPGPDALLGPGVRSSGAPRRDRIARPGRGAPGTRLSSRLGRLRQRLQGAIRPSFRGRDGIAGFVSISRAVDQF